MCVSALELPLDCAQHAQSRAAIEYKLRAVRRNELEAWRISAEPPRGWIHRGRRAAHAPKTQFGDRTCHFPRPMPILRKICPEKKGKEAHLMVAAAGWSVNEIALGKCQTA